MRQRAKTKSKKQQKIEFLEEQLINNTMAIKEGGRKKKFTLYDLKEIKPLTFPQEQMIKSFVEGNNIVANGSAGTGKTLIALYLALNEVLSKETTIDKIIIVRSIVPCRDIGALPGTLTEKIEPYQIPYQDLVSFLLGKSNAYSTLVDTQIINFFPTSYVRGVSWDNAIIILDELQNCNWEEISSVITRTGDNSKVIAIGDYLQNDLYRNRYDQSGIERFLNVAANMKEFDIIKFRKEDIVRSELVKSFLIAAEET